MRIPATPCRERSLPSVGEKDAPTPAPLQQAGLARRFVRSSPLISSLKAKPATEACEEYVRTPTLVPVRKFVRPAPLTRMASQKPAALPVAQHSEEHVAKAPEDLDNNCAVASDAATDAAVAALSSASSGTRPFRCPSSGSGQTAVGAFQGKTFGARIRMMPSVGGGDSGGAESAMLQGKTLGSRLRPGLCSSDGDSVRPQPRQVFVRSVGSRGFIGSRYESTFAPQGADAPDDFVLWEPPVPDPLCRRAVKVDAQITKVLREHQRVGVKFIFDCLMGLKLAFNGFGCILADDMGLGKTLQSVAVMWALLTQGGPNGRSVCHKALVVCPASLVKNWGRELDKWLGGRCKYTAVEVSGKAQVAGTIGSFRCSRESRVLIASYETFRGHAKEVSGCGIDLVLCDEAHKLKSDNAATTKCICALAAKRRLLLSGTPIQNNLEEFFTLVSIANPGIFGEARDFRKRYALPILRGREPTASPEERQLGEETLAAVSEVTEHFILRRTNKLNAKFLPPKHILNVFVTPTDFQRRLYRIFLNSGVARKLLEAKNLRMTGGVLGTIMKLQLLVNHPFLVRNAAERINEGFDDAETQAMFAEVDGADAKLRAKVKPVHEELSGKLLLLHRMLLTMRILGNGDRVVLVSNWTATLDLIEKLCEQYGWPVHRLDGSVNASKRLKLVEDFNRADNPKAFVFLLSSKAGGCGLNLIGANRLVMYDPDWNPANDRQAMARIWRDGQKRTCYIYRLFTTGTIDEKVYQRQICKDGLSTMVVTEAGEEEPAEMKESLAAELVKDLFAYDEHTDCATHDMLNCEHCGATVANGGDPGMQAPDVAEVLEDDLLTWQHHRGINNVADTLLQEASRQLGRIGSPSAPRVSFTMTCTVELATEHIAKLEEEDQVVEQELNKPEKAPDLAKPFDSASAEQQRSKSEKVGNQEVRATVSPELAEPTASASACSHSRACPSSSTTPALASSHAATKQSNSLMPVATSVCSKAKLSTSSTASAPSVADGILDLPVSGRESEVKSTAAMQATSATMDDAILDLPVFDEEVRPKTRAATPVIIDEIIDSPVELVEEHVDAPPKKMRRLSPLGHMHEFDLSSVIAVAEDTCDW